MSSDGFRSWLATTDASILSRITAPPPVPGKLREFADAARIYYGYHGDLFAVVVEGSGRQGCRSDLL